MSLARYAADDVASDSIPRCSREHLRDSARVWAGSRVVAAPPGAQGAIECFDGERLGFYPEGKMFRIVRLARAERTP